MSKLEFAYGTKNRGEVIDARFLSDRDDWVEILATGQAAHVRWNGMSPLVLSVAKHANEVSRLVEKRTGSIILAYYALHHEIEETFTGDIAHDFKHKIFSVDRTQYNELQDDLANQFDLELKHSEIKSADLIVGFAEALYQWDEEVALRCYAFADKAQAEEAFRQVERYRDFINLSPQDKEKDKQEFINRHYRLKTLLDYERDHMKRGSR